MENIKEEVYITTEPNKEYSSEELFKMYLDRVKEIEDLKEKQDRIERFNKLPYKKKVRLFKGKVYR